ncbi:MAG: hypothetical protein KDB82_04065 [Planctomycetes bacterium]|nr:hypothetical protein [Planctomycetota bacterium]
MQVGHAVAAPLHSRRDNEPDNADPCDHGCAGTHRKQQPRQHVQEDNGQPKRQRRAGEAAEGSPRNLAREQLRRGGPQACFKIGSGGDGGH